MISILKKDRAPSRNVFRKGLERGVWRPRLLVGLPAHLRSHEPHEQRDGHELEKTSFRGHAPLGSTGHELVQEVAGGQSYEGRNGSRKQGFHRFYLLKVLFSTALLPQRLSVFQISDNAKSIAYYGLGVKPKQKSASLLFYNLNLINSIIKKFSFLLSVKTWFEPIVFPGSLAVLKSCGEAAPFSRGVARRRRRRNAFGLIQEYCTT